MQSESKGATIAAVGLSCVGVFAVMVAPIFVNALGSSLNFDADQIGNIVFAEIIGGAIASLLATLWIRRINWRVAAGVGLTAVAVLNGFSALQTDANLLTALRFAAGLFGQGTAFAVAIGVFNASSNPDRLFGFSIAAQVAFGVIALLVLTGLSESFGLRGVLWPLGAVALLLLPLIGQLPERSPKIDAADAPTSAASSSTGTAWIALLVLLIWCIGLGSMWAFLIQAGVAGGLDDEVASRAIAISTFIGISGALTASALAGRGGRLAPVTVALLVQIGAIFLLQGEMGFLRFAATAAIFQSFWNFTGPYLMGMVAESDTSGRISVLIPAAQTGGFAIGPWLASRLMNDGSLTAANSVGIGGCALALAVFLGLAIAARKPNSSAA